LNSFCVGLYIQEDTESLVPKLIYFSTIKGFNFVICDLQSIGNSRLLSPI